jgi:hypothetical protein
MPRAQHLRTYGGMLDVAHTPAEMHFTLRMPTRPPAASR